MITFHEAKNLLGDKQSVELIKGVRLSTHDKSYVVIYRKVQIVFMWENGIYQLNTGEWQTKPFFKILNEYSPLPLVKIRDNWAIQDDDKFYQYRDGIRIQHGKVIDTEYLREIVP